MIPYIRVPTQNIPLPLVNFTIPIQPFGVLVGIGLVVGYMLGRRRARLTGLDPDLCADGMVWIVVCGFIVAHLVSVIFYFPDQIIENPLVLLYFWAGISSFGGFIGAMLGAYLYFHRKMGVSALEYADAIIFGFLPGWIIGRMGCATVHDHPGKITDFFLGVHCSEGPCRKPWVVGQTRHDLGLYEVIYSIVLTAILYSLKNVRPFYGFHPALMLMLYAPVRFFFDTLRTDDKLYWGLTPAQYIAVGMFIGGVLLMIYGLRLKQQGIAPGLKRPRRGPDPVPAPTDPPTGPQPADE